MTEHEWAYSDVGPHNFSCEICGCTDQSREAKMPCKGAKPVEPAIRLVRPLQLEYMIVGGFLVNWQNEIYKLTEEQFVGECMRLAGGGLNPQRMSQIYRELMKEAGL